MKTMIAAVAALALLTNPAFAQTAKNGTPVGSAPAYGSQGSPASTLPPYTSPEPPGGYGPPLVGTVCANPIIYVDETVCQQRAGRQVCRTISRARCG